jgi:uncharacterized protein with GYD domain
MPNYISFLSYTGASAKAMIDRPTDRTAAAKALVESLGGKLEGFYWMNGDHDGFLITTLPDSASVAGLSAAASSTGAITGMRSYEIFDREAQAQIVKSAKTALADYKPPIA